MYKNAEGYPDPTQGEGSGGRSVYQGISGKGFGWPESSCGWQSWMWCPLRWRTGRRRSGISGGGDPDGIR